MATWHQQQAMRRAGRSFTLQHETDWCVFHDPYGQMASCRSFTLETDARSYLARVTARGERFHYILTPLWIARAAQALLDNGPVYS